MAAVAEPVSMAARAGQVIVVAREIAKYFDVSAPWLNRVLERSGRQVLHAVDGVSFEIRSGETLALVGESGCGKSTVARMLVGLYTPTLGKVEFFGHDLREMSSAQGRALRQKLQMIFQDPYASLNPRWRVADIVAEPLRTHGLMKDERAIDARVDEVLTQVRLGPADKTK
jgi:peptide/nickel transport system ATP-binding protein